MKNTIKAGDKVRANGREGVALYVFANNGDCAVRFPGEPVAVWYPAHEVKLA